MKKQRKNLLVILRETRNSGCARCNFHPGASPAEKIHQSLRAGCLSLIMAIPSSMLPNVTRFALIFLASLLFCFLGAFTARFAGGLNVPALSLGVGLVMFACWILFDELRFRSRLRRLRSRQGVFESPGYSPDGPPSESETATGQRRASDVSATRDENESLNAQVARLVEAQGWKSKSTGPRGWKFTQIVPSEPRRAENQVASQPSDQPPMVKYSLAPQLRRVYRAGLSRPYHPWPTGPPSKSN